MAWPTVVCVMTLFIMLYPITESRTHIWLLKSGRRLNKCKSGQGLYTWPLLLVENSMHLVVWPMLRSDTMEYVKLNYIQFIKIAEDPFPVPSLTVLVNCVIMKHVKSIGAYLQMLTAISVTVNHVRCVYK